MGEGWETRRRRAAGNEWLAVRLAGQAVVSLVEVDTSGYIGNAPGLAEVRGYAAGGAGTETAGAVGPDDDRGWDDPSSWAPLLPRTPLRPDTPHRFRVSAAACELVRLDVLPDGGVARLRLYGSLTAAGLARVRERWAQTAP
jgi:allantoicase